MPRRHRHRILLGILCLVLACAPASAWTDEVRTRMVRDAVKLMPRSLQRMMEHHDRSLLQGMLSPGSPEDQPEHCARKPRVPYRKSSPPPETTPTPGGLGRRVPIRICAFQGTSSDVGDCCTVTDYSVSH